MFAADTTTITVPSWVGRIALPEYPAMPILGYIMLGMGALLLLIGYFAPIKKIPSLLTAVALLAYYPLACLLYWLLFRYDEQNRALRERTKFEVFLFEYTHAFEWVILGVCAFFGFLFFVWTVWATVRKWQRTRLHKTADEDKPIAQRPPAPRPVAAAPPAAPRPAASPQVPQARKAVKKPPLPPSDNPFDFT
jgi:hypothetical protein